MLSIFVVLPNKLFWCYHQINIDAQLAGEDSPTLFRKLKEGALICGEKYPDCFHLRVKFFIENAALRVFKRKNSKILPYFLPCVVDEMLSEIVFGSNK